MRRAMRSLSGQLILLVVAALVVAQVISLFLFADERSLAIRAALGFEAAGRAANVARLIEEAPLAYKSSLAVVTDLEATGAATPVAAFHPLLTFKKTRTEGRT